ncbi:proton-conducting transporter transmembrane domain-containing protein [Mycolicibacillus parakoreensis]|uniref:proton-conducting transporter transmembrane domain-containing protein n=1 Tax=Mycolicibacillus parakoreensis TaxID=1069221 RepID=UPI00389936FD
MTVAQSIPAREIPPVVRGDGAALLSGLATVLVGAGGIVVGLLALSGSRPELDLAWALPLIGVRLSVEPLGGFFMVMIGAVAGVVGVYWIGYAARERLGATPLVGMPAFAAALLTVPAAGTITTFLLGWELMAIASLVLLLTGHRRAPVRAAAVVYAVMTQLGFIAILTALMLLAGAAGADDFDEITTVPDGVANTVFVLTLLGFGSKAGLLPLHAWLPRAHPEAPSAVSALMSAAMVTLGVYGLVRIDLQLLGPGPRWWGVTLLAVGAISAVYGVLQASVATDLKRLLAYSTTENMGLVVLALGAATLLAAGDARAPAMVALTAALLHLLAHAAFKTLGFFGAGAVLEATGLRDLDRLGGLARRMPATTVLFGIAALGASGLPLGAGFVSEWLLIQSLIHTGAGTDAVIALAMPLAVGAVALTAGLGVAAMVKAFGIGFLARPRSDAAATARETSTSMLVAMTVAGLGCVVVAIFPAVVAPMLDRILEVLPAAAGVDPPQLGAIVRLPSMAGSMGPGLLAAALAAALVLVVVLAGWRSPRRPAVSSAPLWACGADDLSARMQYTATSFAQPLQRVFTDVLRPDTELAVTHLAGSRYLVDTISYRTAMSDVVEDRLYRPVLRAVTGAAQLMRRAHTGSVHLYLAYGAVGVLVILVVAR